MTPSPDAERQRLEGLITPDLLLATDRAFMQAWRGSEGQSNEERGRLGRVAQIEVLVSALLAAPPDPAPAYGAEVLCQECAVVFCPHGERLHFHHDGCPACVSDEPEPAAPGLCEALTPDLVTRLRQAVAAAEAQGWSGRGFPVLRNAVLIICKEIEATPDVDRR